MTSADIQPRLKAFRDTTRYHRSGLVLTQTLPSPVVEELALALPADIISWPGEVVGALRPDQRWVSSDPSLVLENLRRLAQGPAKYVARVVEGLDYEIARWHRQEVIHFWEEFAHLERNARHPVLVVMPTSAVMLLPDTSTLDRLEDDGRLVRFA
jgi:hypothetical protein